MALTPRSLPPEGPSQPALLHADLSSGHCVGVREPPLFFPDPPPPTCPILSPEISFWTWVDNGKPFFFSSFLQNISASVSVSVCVFPLSFFLCLPPPLSPSLSPQALQALIFSMLSNFLETKSGKECTVQATSAFSCKSFPRQGSPPPGNCFKGGGKLRTTHKSRCSLMDRKT